MVLGKSSRQRYISVILLLVSFVALLLLGGSYFIEVQIIVKSPHYGDVTRAIQVFWRVVLGLTTIGSFLIGVYTLIRDSKASNGPPTRVEIKGTGHDINVYPSGPVSEQDTEDKDEQETVSETGSEDETTSTTMAESSESNTDDEELLN